MNGNIRVWDRTMEELFLVKKQSMYMRRRIKGSICRLWFDGCIQDLRVSQENSVAILDIS